MQVIILGMHRSGTSMLTRLINMMGVYFGEDKDSVSTNIENPLGFWERNDVRKINDMVLQASGFEWDCVSEFNSELIPDNVRTKFVNDAAQFVSDMSEHSPWLVKEPRLCLLLSLWQKVLTEPVYIYIYRNPLEVAHSLNTRNGIPICVGVALWERYNIEALKVQSEDFKLIISHEELITKPFKVMLDVYNYLNSIGLSGLVRPEASSTEGFVDSNLYRERYREEQLAGVLNETQMALYDELKSNPFESNIHRDRVLSLGARQELKSYEGYVQKIKRMGQNLSELERLVELALEQFDDLKNSNRWKWGCAIADVKNQLLLQAKTEPKVLESMLEIKRSLELYSSSAVMRK